MSALLVSLSDEIVTALRTIARPTYNFTLSDTVDRVKEGDGGLTMGVPPCVILGGFSIIPAYGGGASLGQYDSAFGLEWWAYAPALSERPKQRLHAAAQLGTDVIQAVHRAHKSAVYPNLYACTKVLCALLNAFGDGQDIPPTCGVAYGTITIVTNTEDGA